MLPLCHQCSAGIYSEKEKCIRRWNKLMVTSNWWCFCIISIISLPDFFQTNFELSHVFFSSYKMVLIGVTGCRMVGKHMVCFFLQISRRQAYANFLLSNIPSFTGWFCTCQMMDTKSALLTRKRTEYECVYVWVCACVRACVCVCVILHCQLENTWKLQTSDRKQMDIPYSQ